MELFARYLTDEQERCIAEGVRVSVIGRRDRLRPSIVRGMDCIECATSRGRRLHLRLAIDYSSRDAILIALRETSAGGLASRDAFSRALNEAIHSRPAAPDVDLLIRTGGERRLSDFLLWECAYAELFFTHRRWPDFGVADLQGAVTEFTIRDRRFGALSSLGAPKH